MKHTDESKRIKGYRLTDPELREKFDHHNDEASLQTVREEIVLLRAMIEQRLNMATNKAEKEAAFQIVTPAIAKVNTLVESLTKLARQTSTMVGKAALHKLGADIVTILTEELDGVPQYDEIIDSVAARITQAVKEARNED